MRQRKAEGVANLNSALAENEAKHDVLVEGIDGLSTALSELTASLEKLTKERSDESAENAATVTEAEEGKAAVEQAIDVLDKFYKTAAKAEEVSLLQEKQPTADMPDAGFG